MWAFHKQTSICVNNSARNTSQRYYDEETFQFFFLNSIVMRKAAEKLSLIEFFHFKTNLISHDLSQIRKLKSFLDLIRCFVWWWASDGPMNFKFDVWAKQTRDRYHLRSRCGMRTAVIRPEPNKQKRTLLTENRHHRWRKLNTQLNPPSRNND